MSPEAARRYAITADGCWLWGGNRNKGGYGLVSHEGKHGLAHRAFYRVRFGEIPAGLDLDHLCHNTSGCAGGKTCLHRRCVNPDHLEPVTRKVNLLRGVGPTATNAQKTHCGRGHEFTARNTAIVQGRRQCRTCKCQRQREYIQRKRLVAANIKETAA